MVHDASTGISLLQFVASRVMARILTRYRQEWRFARHVDVLDDGCRYASVEQRTAAQSTERDSLLGAMARLSEEDRWMVVQLFWHNRDQNWLARRLGISQPAVSKRRTAVLRKLKAALTDSQRALAGTG
jgi:DNA-directed RNA polymerase specialized sigma subunit